MDYFYSIINIFAGMGAFLLGFRLLSENMEKIAGNKLKALFNKTSDKKLVGVGMGAITTAVIQSSAVTTVMVVGFVNAGIMTLYQAAAVIMGANIGTTITAQIVALQAFDVVEFAMILTAVGVFMVMFSKKDKIKTIGMALAGLGLVFMGLKFMSGAMGDFKENETVVNMLQSVTNPFLLLLIGIVITALVQSSSAVTSVIISMASVGFTIGGGGNSVLYIILGSNIGTCVTAFISSIGTNRNAKRACLIHLMFNVFGALIFMIMLLAWPSFMDMTFARWFSEPSTQIAMFHTFFNTVCTILFLPFVKVMVKVTEILIPEPKGKVVEEKTFMDKRFLATPALAINQLRKEIGLLGEMSMNSFRIAYEGLVKRDMDKIPEVFANNDKINQRANEITNYLIEVSASSISFSDEREINALHDNVSDIVRIAELADNLTKYTRKEVKENLNFSDVVFVKIDEMYKLLCEQYNITKDIIANKDDSLISASDAKENEIDRMRKTLMSDHIERMNKGECKAENNNVFVNLVSNLERIGDHLNYIAHSIENI